MSVRSRSILAALIVTAAVGWWFRAHPSTALTLIPPSLEFSVQPGQTVDTKIKLFNEEQNPISVFSSTANFGAKGEEGEPDFDFQDTPSDLASWIDIGGGPFTLQPGDRLEIPVTIRVPQNAEPGGHYASVFFGTDPSLKPEEGGGQVSVRSLIGSLIILRVAGEVRETASIKSFGQADAGALNRLPAGLQLRVANQGNVHIRPQGTVIIRNLFGGETARLTINEANGAVLPNSVRRFDVSWSKHENSGARGNFFQEIGAEWRNFALGSYTATAILNYGQANLTLQADTRITIIPWRILTLFGLGLILVIVGLRIGIQRYNASVINRAEHRSPPAGPKG